MTIKTQNTTLKNQQTKEKKVLYPIFNECAEFTLDPFWTQLFDECAKGKFPKGSSIDQNSGMTIYFKTKTDTVSYNMKEKSPEQIFSDLKQHFQVYLKLKSVRDNQEIQEELDDICKDLQEIFTSSWQNIRKKKIKDPIIRSFILDLKERYDLNDKETCQLAKIIKLGFLFNWIENDNVIYENQQIIDITTLTFDSEERVFTLEEPDIKHKREYKPKCTKLSKLWAKHLEKPKNTYF